jgi:hypothetical protein
MWVTVYLTLTRLMCLNDVAPQPQTKEGLQRYSVRSEGWKALTILVGASIQNIKRLRIKLSDAFPSLPCLAPPCAIAVQVPI